MNCWDIFVHYYQIVCNLVVNCPSHYHLTISLVWCLGNPLSPCPTTLSLLPSLREGATHMCHIDTIILTDLHPKVLQ